MARGVPDIKRDEKLAVFGNTLGFLRSCSRRHEKYAGEQKQVEGTIKMEWLSNIALLGVWVLKQGLRGYLPSTLSIRLLDKF